MPLIYERVQQREAARCVAGLSFANVRALGPTKIADGALRNAIESRDRGCQSCGSSRPTGRVINGNAFPPRGELRGKRGLENCLLLIAATGLSRLNLGVSLNGPAGIFGGTCVRVFPWSPARDRFAGRCAQNRDATRPRSCNLHKFRDSALLLSRPRKIHVAFRIQLRLNGVSAATLQRLAREIRPSPPLPPPPPVERHREISGGTAKFQYHGCTYFCAYRQRPRVCDRDGGARSITVAEFRRASSEGSRRKAATRCVCSANSVFVEEVTLVVSVKSHFWNFIPLTEGSPKLRPTCLICVIM